MTLRHMKIFEAVFRHSNITKAAEELAYADRFDYILVNDDLDTAFAEAEKVVGGFISDSPGK